MAAPIAEQVQPEALSGRSKVLPTEDDHRGIRSHVASAAL
jgi:hypothetical protein